MKPINPNYAPWGRRLLAGLFLATAIYTFFLPPPHEFRKKKMERVKTFDPLELELQSLGKISTSWQQTITLITPCTGLQKILYGHPDFGFFSTTDFHCQKRELRLKLVPPFYEKPLSFYRNQRGQHQKIATRRFQAQDYTLLRKLKVELQGEFSSPFFALSGLYYPHKGLRSRRRIFFFILNKWGQVVFVHFPGHGRKNLDKYATVKEVTPGTWGILYSEQDSYFEVINFKGEQLQELDAKAQNLVIHHDFIYDPDDETLLTLGNRVGHHRTLPQSLSWRELINGLAPPFTVLLNNIIKVDLKTKSAQEVWNPWEHYFLYQRGNTFDQLHLFSRFPELPPNVWSFWGEKAQVDAMHANSLSQVPGGYLLSLRNLSQILFLDHDFKLQWSLGAHEGDDYQPLNYLHQFYHQHHVTMTRDHKILLVDNHVSPPAPYSLGTRLLELQLSPKRPGSYKVIWNFQPRFDFFSLTRGSAYELPNQNIIGYYPDNRGGEDFLFEVDWHSGRPKAIIRISFDQATRVISQKQVEQLQGQNIQLPSQVYLGGGNRALPLFSIQPHIWEKPL